MKKNFLMILAMFAAVAVFTTGCGDDDKDVNKTNSISADDKEATSNEEETQSIYEDLDELGISALTAAFEGGKTTVGTLGDCAEVSHNVNDKIVTVNFGEGCTGPRGRVRSGVIVISYTGRHHEMGSVVITEFDGFYVDGVKIEGKRTVTNTSESPNDFPRWNVKLENGKVTWPDETYATRAVNRTKTWVRAENILNDEFHLEGRAEGKTREGNTYETEIIETIVFKVSCLDNQTIIPVEGIKNIIINETLELNVEYGDGACDNVVTIRKGEDTLEVDVTARN